MILGNRFSLVVKVSLRFEFSATNNQDEYEDVIVGMAVKEDMGVENIKL